MAISGTNQSKNVVSPYGQRKAGIYLWGDPDATWGDALATWGTNAIAPTNQNKSSILTFIELEDSNDFLLEDSTTVALEGGSGMMAVTNQSKS